ncbi:MAG: RHS repeat protein, partial [Erysipelotrichaceae bacterium]|nr:RHS repeat protein [Erysipelotrichaceae bacterium]
MTTEYTYNELNQMTAAVSRQGGNTLSSVTCAYDANGNQISETDSILGTNTTYTYDPAGQLTQAVKSENNVQTLLQENRYDGEGQRIQKTVQAQSPGNITQTTRNYHYQNGEVLYTDDGSVTDAFQVLGAAENVISTIRPEGSGYAWYLYSDDIRGSISSLTDESGDIAAAYEYDE